jgi:hypothetical protein
MSKVAIKGASTGTATFTIESPATNTDRTLVLPDNAGTVLTSASNLAGVTGVGKVLQVVSATTSTQVSISGTTYTDSGLSASITPTSATSKILVLVNQSTINIGSSTNIVASGVRLLRNSTAILEPYTDGTGPLEPYIEVIGASQLYNSFRHNINFLDSPATTSSVTYKTQGRLRSSGGGQALTFQAAGVATNGTSTITLMEIAG